jgi:hypothetical protein
MTVNWNIGLISPQKHLGNAREDLFNLFWDFNFSPLTKILQKKSFIED